MFAKLRRIVSALVPRVRVYAHTPAHLHMRANVYTLVLSLSLREVSWGKFSGGDGGVIPSKNDKFRLYCRFHAAAVKRGAAMM